MDEFETLCEKFLEHVKESKKKDMERSNFNHKVDYHFENGMKWLKVVCVTNTRSAYAFIAKEDMLSKSLGFVKKGDIHKPANWKTPARTARGSIFDETSWTCAGPYGMAYLR